VGAQPAARLEAIEVRQHDVEHDDVEVRRPRHRDALLAGRCDVGHDALRAERTADGRRHAHLVLHDQHVHLHLPTLATFSHPNVRGI
jgi:hypothetical protein